MFPSHDTYRNRNGTKTALPIYYRNKIYSEEEREKLWLEKLDKQERWVGGEKVSVKDNDEQYLKLREYYRKLNKSRGYGTDEKNEEDIEYQNKLRAIRAAERERRITEAWNRELKE